MKIIIQAIPQSEQRYPTVGDYWTDPDGTIQVRVTRMRREDMAAVIIHELVEKFLCLEKGIGDDAIDAFDFTWQPYDGIFEPGDDPAAPYHLEHVRATRIERLMVAYLGQNWLRYCSRVDSYLNESLSNE
jgi:hypothetical protein